MANPSLLLLPGDGIGPEVTVAAHRTLKKVAEVYGHSFRFEVKLMGGAAIDKTGNPLPPDTMACCMDSAAVFLGAVGGPKWDSPHAMVRPEKGLLELRAELGVYANLRPVKVMDELVGASPLKAEVVKGVDLIVVGRHGRGGLSRLMGSTANALVQKARCEVLTVPVDTHGWFLESHPKLKPIDSSTEGIYLAGSAQGPKDIGPAVEQGHLRPVRPGLDVVAVVVVDGDEIDVGARLLGYEPQEVPHLAIAAANHGRPTDLSDVTVLGESIEELASRHRYDFPYASDETGEMPLPLAKQGIKGIFYRKYDDTMCTYCSQLNGLTLTAIRFAWKEGIRGRLEVLTGKRMQPTPGMEKTLLLGKCMYQKHKNNPDINEMIAVKGCPPKPADIVKALHQAGIQADPGLFENMDQLPGFFMERYKDRPEFEESFFRVKK